MRPGFLWKIWNGKGGFFMKNPLRKRILRELRQDAGKYAVIFLFMVMLISLVSGFLVADNSVTHAYYEGFTRYNLEWGHFTFNKEPSQDLVDQIEEETEVRLVNLNYLEESYEEKKNIRIYKDRQDVNLECLMSGKMPETEDEIALDRMFARNAGLEVGDQMELNHKQLTISGLIALPDYSCLYENNSDMMFDSVNFCVAVMTDQGYDALNSSHEHYNYAWVYDHTPADDAEEADQSDDFLDDLTDIIKHYDRALANEREEELDRKNDKLQDEMNDLNSDLFDEEDKNEMMEEMAHLMGQFIKLNEEATDDSYIVSLDDYIPRYANQAIQFTGEDMGSDKAMFILFDYIVVAILAFVFAVTISNTISQEAGVIGTLRASGYTRGELVAHYMVLPVMVTILAAIIGNILGYGIMKEYMVSMYYNSYSLCTYQTLWNAEAFLDTTVIPIILMFFINLFVLIRKLQLSPLKFLRHDLSKKRNKRALPLPGIIPFMHRFRMRVLFQNIPAYLVLFLGVFFAGALAVFGTMFGPMLDDYAQLVVDSEICRYQYILKDHKKTKIAGAEKYTQTSLDSTNEDYLTDEIGVYGIVKESQYIHEEIPEGQVLVSNGMMSKFGYQLGDTITLKDHYSDDSYEFVIGGEYKYDAALCIFMDYDAYLETFDEDDDYMTGYFSDQEITDIDEEYIAGVVNEDDLTKTATQLKVSMGEFMNLLNYFAVAMFLMMMYLLTKQIIEKNSQSISMVKILGFTDGEIGLLYLAITSLVVLLSLLLSIPLIDITLRWIFQFYMYKEITGYIPYIVRNSCYVRMVLMGIASYLFVAVLLLWKIRRIPMAEALKNVE